jgi:hypothetical protein
MSEGDNGSRCARARIVSPTLADFPVRSVEKLRFADTDRNGHITNTVFAACCQNARMELLCDVQRVPVPRHGSKDCSWRRSASRSPNPSSCSSMQRRGAPRFSRRRRRTRCARCPARTAKLSPLPCAGIWGRQVRHGPQVGVIAISACRTSRSAGKEITAAALCDCGPRGDGERYVFRGTRGRGVEPNFSLRDPDAPASGQARRRSRPTRRMRRRAAAELARSGASAEPC